MRNFFPTPEFAGCLWHVGLATAGIQRREETGREQQPDPWWRARLCRPAPDPLRTVTGRHQARVGLAASPRGRRAPWLPLSTAHPRPEGAGGAIAPRSRSQRCPPPPVALRAALILPLAGPGRGESESDFTEAGPGAQGEHAGPRDPGSPVGALHPASGTGPEGKKGRREGAADEVACWPVQAGHSQS